MPTFRDTLHDKDGNLLSEKVWDTDAGTLNGAAPTDPADIGHLQELTRESRRDRRVARIGRLLSEIDADARPNRWTVAILGRRLLRLERAVRDIWREIQDEDDEQGDAEG